MDFDRQAEKVIIIIFKKLVWVVLLVVVVVFFKYYGFESKSPYHDPIFDKVMPKEPTLDELKAIRARREPLVENPTEEDIAIMRADIDEYRKRYEVNVVCKDKVSRTFEIKYGYYSKYREAIKPLIEELALNGDMFALSTNSLRVGNTWFAAQEAAHKGELTHRASEGWFLATGFNRARDKVLGEKYMMDAANRGGYSGYKLLIRYYYSYKYVSKLCITTNEAYKRYGLEIFSYEIKKEPSMMEYIQNNCHVFSDKDYTSEEMKFEYLKDIDTDESRLMQAMIMSNVGRYAEAKTIFEALEDHADQKIRANAQLCLSRMYYYGDGVGKDKTLADLYADKAFDNGSYGAKEYPNLGKHWPRQIIMPSQLILTDYNCVYGACFYHDIKWE